MPYQSLHERLPEIAKRETRQIIVIDDPVLPADEYALIEAYCNEPDCDCRRVMFNVFSRAQMEVVAVIAWGWESRKFYTKWFNDNDPQIIRELQGPVLNSMSAQSKLAPELLNKIEVILKDKQYAERIKRHYEMFRATVDTRNDASQQQQTLRVPKVGRNTPCPCGSGKNTSIVVNDGKILHMLSVTD